MGEAASAPPAPAPPARAGSRRGRPGADSGHTRARPGSERSRRQLPSPPRLCLQSSSSGHSSVEDARATMELYHISLRIRDR
ncbi:hypothetical protein J0S82_016051 [Galemys pyrenaicus]|uniref:Uncharacterized protein n=1 Tax=Galemys pyrenaicus TaxID=202257 RepID=A0A8J6AC67_GALPY|nr:hypothetical protein J0S82_016051 [Galemys pyrenaicus]